MPSLFVRATVLLLALLAASHAQAAATRKTASIPVFLSSDLGCEIDDQWPLVHLLGDPRFNLRVIATAQAPAEAVPGLPAEASAALVRHIVRDRLKLANPPRVVTGSNQPLTDLRTPRQSEALNALLEVSKPFNSRNRLTVLVIGAATDVASALLTDPGLENRIRIVAMGFRSPASGDEFNVKNDPDAWRVILSSRVPLVIGDLGVTSRRLSLTKTEARSLLSERGVIGAWLLRDYDVWYEKVTRTFLNPGRPSGSPSWPIWDEVVIAHLLGQTRTVKRPRPVLTDDLKLIESARGTVDWITDLDRNAVFSAFRQSVARLTSGKHLVDQACVTIAREANACWRAGR